MNDLTSRMMRAARLDASLYEEVENDANAMAQAMSVVVISSVAAALGVFPQLGIGGTIATTFGALLGWYVWAYLTYAIGVHLLPETETRADLGQMLRTTGFSAAPGVLRVFSFVPGLGSIIVLIASMWMLAAMVVAVRQALDYSTTGRALVVCLVGFVVQGLLLAILFLAVGFP